MSESNEKAISSGEVNKIATELPPTIDPVTLDGIPQKAVEILQRAGAQYLEKQRVVSVPNIPEDDSDLEKILGIPAARARVALNGLSMFEDGVAIIDKFDKDHHARVTEWEEPIRINEDLELNQLFEQYYGNINQFQKNKFTGVRMSLQFLTFLYARADNTEQTADIQKSLGEKSHELYLLIEGEEGGRYSDLEITQKLAAVRQAIDISAQVKKMLFSDKVPYTTKKVT
jgi:hypothetical protein